MTLSWGATGVLLLVLVAARVVATLVLSHRQSRTVARNREQVPEAFAQVLTLAAHHRAADYTRANQSVNRRVTLWDAVVLLGWTLGGGLNALDDACRRLVADGSGTRALILQGCLLVVGFTTLNALFDLPATLWRTFRIEQRFGFNRTNARVFVADQLKGAAISMVVGLPLWSAVLYLLSLHKPLSWLWAWAVFAALSLIMVWAGPRVIAPLFNTFRPLDDHPVKARIDALMRRCGYDHGGLFVMDGSARSTHGNAYFTGLGRSKRVVFFDTLLESLKDDEIEGVLAHELGHFALGHIQKQLAVSMAVSLVLFYGAAQALEADGLFVGLGLAQASLGARVLALTLLASQVSFWLTPVLTAVSRRREFEADAYACTWASGDALGRALVKLFVDNGATLTPDGAYTAFYSSHPPAVQRLARLEKP